MNLHRAVVQDFFQFRPELVDVAMHALGF
jgi:hypothetical protein